MEAVSFSEMMVNISHTRPCINPDKHLSKTSIVLFEGKCSEFYISWL